jgi:hypothetical protein
MAAEALQPAVCCTVVMDSQAGFQLKVGMGSSDGERDDDRLTLRELDSRARF